MSHLYSSPHHLQPEARGLQPSPAQLGRIGVGTWSESLVFTARSDEIIIGDLQMIYLIVSSIKPLTSGSQGSLFGRSLFRLVTEILGADRLAGTRKRVAAGPEKGTHYLGTGGQCMR